MQIVQNSQKRPQRKSTLTSQQTTEHLRCGRTGTKVVSCLSSLSQLHQFVWDKKADTHTLVHTEFAASWTQSSQSSTSEDTQKESLLTTSKHWVCLLSTPSHVLLTRWGWGQAWVFCFFRMQVWKVSSIPKQRKENWLPEQLELFKT